MENCDWDSVLHFASDSMETHYAGDHPSTSFDATPPIQVPTPPVRAFSSLPRYMAHSAHSPPMMVLQFVMIRPRTKTFSCPSPQRSILERSIVPYPQTLRCCRQTQCSSTFIHAFSSRYPKIDSRTCSQRPPRRQTQSRIL